MKGGVSGGTIWTSLALSGFADDLMTAESRELVKSAQGCYKLCKTKGPDTSDTVLVAAPASERLRVAALPVPRPGLSVGGSRRRRGRDLHRPLVPRRDRVLDRPSQVPRYDKVAKTWVAPFVMAAVNAPVVSRSMELLGRSGTGYDEVSGTVNHDSTFTLETRSGHGRWRGRVVRDVGRPRRGRRAHGLSADTLLIEEGAPGARPGAQPRGT